VWCECRAAGEQHREHLLTDQPLFQTHTTLCPPAHPHSLIAESEDDEGEESSEQEEEEQKKKPQQQQHAGDKRKAQEKAAAPTPASKKPATAAAATPQQQQQQQQQKDKQAAKTPQQQAAKTPQQQAAAAKTPQQQQQQTPGSAKRAKPRVFDNGFEIHELKMGQPDGRVARAGKRVSMRYVGRLVKGGKVFDSNTKGKPFQFRLGVGEVIKGWVSAVFFGGGGGGNGGGGGGGRLGGADREGVVVTRLHS